VQFRLSIAKTSSSLAPGTLFRADERIGAALRGTLARGPIELTQLAKGVNRASEGLTRYLQGLQRHGLVRHDMDGYRLTGAGCVMGLGRFAIRRAQSAGNPWQSPLSLCRKALEGISVRRLGIRSAGPALQPSLVAALLTYELAISSGVVKSLQRVLAETQRMSRGDLEDLRHRYPDDWSELENFLLVAQPSSRPQTTEIAEGVKPHDLELIADALWLICRGRTAVAKDLYQGVLGASRLRQLEQLKTDFSHR
jgi:predicted transcriptional regulator